MQITGKLTPKYFFRKEKPSDDAFSLEKLTAHSYQLKLRRNKESLKGASIASRLAMPVVTTKAVDTILSFRGKPDSAQSQRVEKFARLVVGILDSGKAHKTKLREIASLGLEYLNRNTLKEILAKLKELDPESDDFIETAMNSLKPFISSENMDVRVNFESDELAEAIDNNEACVFIMNHDNLALDPFLLRVFNYFLYSKYLDSGQTRIPKPQALTSSGILDTKTKTQKEIDELIGSVSIRLGDKMSPEMVNRNGRVITGLIRDLVDNKANIFVFPEGRNAVKRWESTEQRFQHGISKIVQKAAKKRTVKVFPVGFAFQSKFSSRIKQASINVGKAMNFSSIAGLLSLNNVLLGEDRSSEKTSGAMAEALVLAKESAGKLLVNPKQLTI